MIEINHYTMNTGHQRKTTPDEVNKQIYVAFRGYIKKALSEEGTDFLDNTHLKITEEDIGYVATLSGYAGNELIPIFVTAGTSEKDGRKYIWDAVCGMIPEKNSISQIPVPTPYILDYVLPTAVAFPQVLSWTGDFSRCLGWAMMFPKEIR